mmetsp:Transcript_14457/g.43724  ORF Transcript_14457/g.43724 Transcript_14457/m.43724 type:complete len:269 (-) Transcript_14457:1004-1810(-)
MFPRALPMHPRVTYLEKPKHTCCQVPVYRLLGFSGGRGEAALDDGTDQMHQPRQLALHDLQVLWPCLAGGGRLLVGGHQGVHEGQQEVGSGAVLEAAQEGDGIQLVRHLLLVVQGVLPAPLHRRCHAVQPAGDVGLVDARHVGVQQGGGVALQVRHAADQARPQAQQIIHAARRPLPAAQAAHRQVRHQLDPLRIPVHPDQLRQLVVGFEAAQEAAELVVVRVLGQAPLRAQDVPCARRQVVQELGALALAGEQAPPHTRQPHQAFQR